jgi:hypothetical protein
MLPQAVFHTAFLVIGGFFFFAIALLITSFLDGEYTAPSAWFVVVIALAHLLDGKTGYNLWDFMLGSEHLQTPILNCSGYYPDIKQLCLGCVE